MPERLIELGERLGVAPVGKPLTVRFTVSLNPPEASTVTLNEVLLPPLTVAEEGAMEREKSGFAGP